MNKEKDAPVDEPKSKSFIEEILVVNNVTNAEYTYKCKDAPHGLSFGYGRVETGTAGLLIINRLFSKDGKDFEGVARLTNFSILNIKLK
ncbi:MAG TPA: hypothetical protein ACFYEK_01290 [Candidatus Wunengus sp. YC60]|uniref:hypothetical protein n=1 Tax=Candidatus Wunengus sp. YC60 TaxID=3367697 RepID=UPI0040276EDA